MTKNFQTPDNATEQGVTDSKVAAALEQLQKGNVDRADKLLRDALVKNRNNIDALYLLGLVGCRTQHWVEAVELIGRAIEIDPRRIKYYGDLGVAQLALERFDDAMSSFQQLLSHEPENALALFNMGRTLVLSGKRSEAIPLIEQAVITQPTFLEARRALASLLLDHGRAPDAVDQYEKIIQQAPDDIEAIANCGAAMTAAGRANEAVALLSEVSATQKDNPLVLGNLGLSLAAADRGEEAVSYLQEALELEPENPRILNNFGNMLRKLGRLEEAEHHLSHALALRDDYIEARNNLALTYFDQERYEGAEIQLTQALAVAPNAPRILNNLGLVQQYTNRMDEAVVSFSKALELEPSYLEAETNLATVYSGIGNLAEAIRMFDAVLLRNPTNLTARWNRCNALLLNGDYGLGWDEYELRWAMSDEVPRTFTQPHWVDDDLSNKSIMVYGEQGPGDVVMFSHCLGELIAHTKHVTLQVDERLVTLLRRSFPTCTVDTERQVDGLWRPSDADFVVAFGSLPRRFRRKEKEFKVIDGPYLQSDPKAVTRWRNRYTALGEGPVVGISWRGGANALERSRRVLQLADWSKLLSDPRLTIVNLQHGNCEEEIAQFKNDYGVTIHSWDDTGVNLDEFAAQVESLDLVISVANTTVHFAGALDKTVWMLVPSQPSWRWQIDRADSPWYRSVRIFRQGKDEKWGSVLDTISKNLKQWVDDGRVA